MSPEGVKHTGIIKGIHEERLIIELMDDPSECSHCHIKETCSVADIEKKTIEVTRPSGGKFTVGDNVNVIAKNAMALRAVFWGYFLPFLLVLTVLIAGVNFWHNEIYAGIAAIAVLFPYYGVLYIFREKIRREFEFKLLMDRM